MIRHSDQKGVIAEISDILYQKPFNIARMENERSKINGAAITICQSDNTTEDTLLSLLKRESPIIAEI